MEIVKLLVENGADINDHGPCWLTPFQNAILENEKEMVKLFMENGADFKIRTRSLQVQHKNDSFELAMKEDQMNILKQLLHYSEK